MRHYRLYYLDSKGRHIDVRDFRAAGDLAAIASAGIARSGEKRELWNQERRVLELVV
jgi:hypothetical protein